MFRDVTALIEDNPAKLHYGCCVGEFGAAGVPTVLVCGFGGSNTLLAWDGSKLVDATPLSLADIGRRAIGACAGDIDGDGLEELYIVNADRFTGRTLFPDRLYARTPGGWADMLERGSTFQSSTFWSGRSVAALDRTGSGRYGFVVAAHGAPLRLVEFDTRGGLSDNAAAAGLVASGAGRSLLVAPLVSPGQDVFAGYDAGPNRLFRHQPDGTYVECAAALGLDAPGQHARGCAVLDYDEDGQLDLLSAGWQTTSRLYLANDGGTFGDTPLPALNAPGPVRTAIVADFDNDGYQEIFLNLLGEKNRLFGFRRGAWQELDPGPALLENGFGTGATVGDFDGDGVLELLISQGEVSPQPLALFKAARPSPHFLRIMPLTRQGAPARNALVELEQAGRRQVRVIDGGSGYLCQMEPWAHFGVTDGSFPCSVRIRWPDGSEKRLGPLGPGTVLRVPHPAQK